MTDLSKKLKYALDNPDDVEAFIPKVMNKLSVEYNWDLIVDKYVEIYQNIAKEKGRE